MSIITFKGAFDTHIKKFSRIKLDERDIHNCVSYIRAVVKHKHNTTKLNKNNEKYKDMFTLTCAITAISKRIKHPIMDYNNVNVEPLQQLRNSFEKWVDVIMFNYNEFPIFYRPMYKKAIFVCKVSDTEFIVCGYATPRLIDSFHSKMLVNNQTIREQSNMSAFYGFDRLSPIPNNVYDFKNLFI
jgi:hypothetical protein